MKPSHIKPDMRYAIDFPNVYKGWANKQQTMTRKYSAENAGLHVISYMVIFHRFKTDFYQSSVSIATYIHQRKQEYVLFFVDIYLILNHI